MAIELPDGWIRNHQRLDTETKMPFLIGCYTHTPTRAQVVVFPNQPNNSLSLHTIYLIHDSVGSRTPPEVELALNELFDYLELRLPAPENEVCLDARPNDETESYKQIKNLGELPDSVLTSLRNESLS